MREFIYFSDSARTSGNYKDMMKAGRMDIVNHIVIAALFISNKMRNDVQLHLILNGPPDAPKHLELFGSERLRKVISKKDISGLIKRMLFKYKKGKQVEAFPACLIEKKSLKEVIEKLKGQKKTIYVLDESGENIRKAKLAKNSVFVIGDHEGFPKREKKLLKKEAKKISLGNKIYFASQSLVILQNELDLRED